ncbi:MAG: DUF2293 domain-containing protein [Salinarimonas sp.]|nr:DUF2293 domain-containing protein [Salinarimonas sp.]
MRHRSDPEAGGPVQRPAGPAAGRRERIGQALERLAPDIPRFEREAILDHAIDSPGLARADPENAAWLSMVAYIRHVLTDYDALLAEGFDQDAARFFVLDEINDYLAEWGSKRQVDGEG